MDKITDQEAFFNFISGNAGADTSRLRLKYHSCSNPLFDYDFAILQIESRRKHGKKLRRFFSNPHTLVPTPLSAEQATHEAVAAYHASLASGGATILDMTAGLGIDSFALARKAAKIVSVEIDPLKADVLRHNATVLGLDNLTAECGDSSAIDDDRLAAFDIIFIDPARRGDNNQRLYNLRDCMPDVTSLVPRIFKAGAKLIIKASPLLDITQTLNDIPGIEAIRCISVDGECKEVLVECSRDGVLSEIEAVNLSAAGEKIFSFRVNPGSSNSDVVYAGEDDVLSSRFLYEPDASVMKLAPWGAICSAFPGLKKLAPSSHLFVSEEYADGFPGRTLRILETIDKKRRKSLKGFPANVVCRNYPLSAPELRKKLAVAEGMSSFIYGTRIGDKPILLLTEKF